MVEVTKAKARILFDKGLCVYCLPDSVLISNATFQKLTLRKSFFCKEFPEERIREYESIYCNKREVLKFYVQRIKVLIARRGVNGFFIRDAENKNILDFVSGNETQLIRYVKSHYMEVVNYKYLEPQHARKLMEV